MDSRLHWIGGIRHAVWGGEHDDRAERCRVQVYRCGKAFEIVVAGRDVEHTNFHHLWHQLVDEDMLRELSRFEKWFRLCELILNLCKDLLEELAPAGSDWKTFRDHLHCPMYTLKLQKAETAGERIAAYRVNMDDFVKNLQTCVSESVLPDSWHVFVSTTVRGPDGRLCTLVPCEHDAPKPQPGETNSPSWDRIRAYVHLANSCVDTYSVLRVSSIVTDDNMVAGVLIEYVDCKSSVQGLIKAAVSVEQLLSLEHKLALWRAQITKTVATLHEHGITLTTSLHGSSIHEGNMEVDQHYQVWLLLSFGAVDMGVGPGVLEHKALDINNLRAVFDERLPAQMIAARRRLTTA